MNAQPVSRLETLLRSGVFTVTGEIAPPKAASRELVERAARHLGKAVDAINVTDNQRGLARMSSLGAGVSLEQAGYEAVVQITCQHRNRVALQADVLSMAALGIRNIVAMTGDSPRLGDHVDAKSVLDVNSFKLLRTVQTLRDDGTFTSGTPLREAPRLFIGAVANPNIEQASRTEKKIEAGAEFIQTQPIFDLELFRRWIAEARDLGLPERAFILAGIMLVRSPESAAYMQEHIKGVGMTEEVIARLAGAADPAAEGLRLAVDTIRAVRDEPGVAGVHLMSISWSRAIPQVVEGAGLLPRPVVCKPELSPLGRRLRKDSADEE
ncbi:MAG TPA: methylenetetrahydrofolate reductase [Chloroflexota bacterium]